jgi:hypothetical protein
MQERAEAVASLRPLMSRHRHRFGLPTAALLLLLLTALAGCGGDDDGDEEADKNVKPVAGTFVSKAEGSEALVSVVAEPRAKGQDKRAVSVFVCDADQLCQAFTASTAANDFTATAGEEGGEAKGELSAKTASGTIEPPEGDSIRYKAAAAPATAGLYDLTVSRDGKLKGASAAGVALTGTLELPPPGTGSLKLADGRRVKLEVVKGSGEVSGLRPGQVRLIVLPDRQLRGAGMSRGGGEQAFFVRSSAK